jgi:hypothetical protein
MQGLGDTERTTCQLVDYTLSFGHADTVGIGRGCLGSCACCAGCCGREAPY